MFEPNIVFTKHVANSNISSVVTPMTLQEAQEDFQESSCGNETVVAFIAPNETWRDSAGLQVFGGLCENTDEGSICLLLEDLFVKAFEAGVGYAHSSTMRVRSERVMIVMKPRDSECEDARRLTLQLRVVDENGEAFENGEVCIEVSAENPEEVKMTFDI